MTKLRCAGLFSVLLFSVFSLPLCAQNQHYLQTAFGLALGPIKDYTISSQGQKMMAGNFRLGYRLAGEKWEMNLIAETEGGYLNMFNYPEYGSRSADHFRFRFDADFLKHIPSTANEAWRFMAGFQLSTNYEYNQIRSFSNSETNFNWITPLGLKVKTYYQVPWLRTESRLFWAFNLPIAAFLARPAYSVPFENNELTHTKVASWGNYFGMDISTGWTFPIGELNAMQLRYDWYYNQYLSENRLFRAVHAITINFFLNL